MRIPGYAAACAVFLVLAASAVEARQEENFREEFVRWAGCQAVTGREARFVDFIRKQLPAGADAEVDNMGSLIVRIGGGAPDLMVIASVDEPGYVVTNITDGGFLMVDTPAGRGPSTLFDQFHEGHYVDIATRGGVLRGLVALPSSHIFRGERENLTPERIRIDIGARSREEALARGVEILDPATAVKDIALLAGNRVAGPMLSRKIGPFALMQALQPSNPKQGKTVLFAWATESYLRNSGAMRLARRYSPARVLVVGPFQSRRDGRSGPVEDPVDALDSGVLIPDLESTLLNALTSAAAGGSIRLTRSVTGTLPEVRAFSEGKADVVPVGIAVKFPGSLVEVIDLDDLHQLVEIVRLAVQM